MAKRRPPNPATVAANRADLLRSIDMQNRVALPPKVMDALEAQRGDLIQYEFVGPKDIRIRRATITVH